MRLHKLPQFWLYDDVHKSSTLRIPVLHEYSGVIKKITNLIRTYIYFSLNYMSSDLDNLYTVHTSTSLSVCHTCSRYEQWGAKFVIRLRRKSFVLQVHIQVSLTSFCISKQLYFL